MSLFLPHELLLTEKDPTQRLDELNNVYDQVSGKKRSSLQLTEFSGFRVSNKARDHTQLLLWRILDLLENMLLLSRSGTHLSVFIISRSAVETIASLNYFCGRIIELVETSDESDLPQKVDKCVTKLTFSTGLPSITEKLPGDDFKAINIMTMIDYLEKTLPGVRGEYEKDSDLVHPNSLGTRIWYGEFDSQKDSMSYSNSPPQSLEHSALGECYKVAGYLPLIAWRLQALEAQLFKLSDIGHRYRAALDDG